MIEDFTSSMFLMALYLDRLAMSSIMSNIISIKNIEYALLITRNCNKKIVKKTEQNVLNLNNKFILYHEIHLPLYLFFNIFSTLFHPQFYSDHPIPSNYYN